MLRIFTAIFALAIVLGTASFVNAEEPASDALLLINAPTIELYNQTAPVPSVGEEKLPPALQAEVPPLTMLTAVAKARELLAPVLVDFKKKEPGVKPVPKTTSQVAAAVAIWNKIENTVTVYGGTRGLKYFTADAGGWTMPIVTRAGARTAFRGKGHNLVVVGTVQADMVAVTVKKTKVYKPTFAYYVPYNKELYSVETLASGSDYLTAIIQEAFDDLDANGITSRAFPGKPLTAVIDPYLIKSIAVIEHADSQIYEDDNAEEALGRFLVKLALNRDNALNTTTSSAGAVGMVQFIPSTYKLMVTKRPDLKLIEDFKAGMADHKNAIKAEAAYLDMILADLPDSVRALYADDKGKAAEYLAAGYNGGSVRVKKAILAWGDAWSVSHGNVASSLRKETVSYVVKLRRVYDMLAAGFFATPKAPTGALPSGVVAYQPPAAP